jgi:ABC-type sugar transport system permease subunit
VVYRGAPGNRGATCAEEEGGLSATADWAKLTLSDEEYAREARRYRRRKSLRGYAFVVPYFIPWILFLAVPAVWSVVLSFHAGGLTDEATFVGLDNWSRAAGNPELRKSSVNTFYMVLIAISIAFVLSMCVALLLNTYRRGSTVFKLALYFPLLAPPVIAGLIWQYMVHYDFGVANLVADQLGADKINFLGNARLALLTVVAVEVWRGFGFWVLYFLAGVQGVPGELLDAARVDGASGARRFFRVTVPILRPLLLFAVVIAIIYNFQIFDSVYSLTDGGPALGTSTIVWFIYRNLFEFQNTGLAYATSIGLLCIILLLTFLSFRLLGAERRSTS